MDAEHAGEGREGGPDYLGMLDEETMNLAWGPDRSAEDRRRIVDAAVTFGRMFDERMVAAPPASLEEKDFQRFLMGLMNAVIAEFASREGISEAESGAFLGDIRNRDHVLELNEVLEAFAQDPDISLNEHLRAAVEGRQDKAVWARHFRSG
jgi:hypothetical protein